MTGDFADAQSASAENATPWAANGAQVTRFADEIPYGPDAIVKRDGTQVRRSPGSGDVLATLPAGTDVVKLSTHNSEDLVCFDDPDGGLHLVGWVPQSAISGAQHHPATGSRSRSPPLEEDAEVPPPLLHPLRAGTIIVTRMVRPGSTELRAAVRTVAGSEAPSVPAAFRGRASPGASTTAASGAGHSSPTSIAAASIGLPAVFRST